MPYHNISEYAESLSLKSIKKKMGFNVFFFMCVTEGDSHRGLEKDTEVY